ncbi:MAG: hypothetical protein AB2784_19920 [Candidatus Thiodiazotropha endolucinida]
MTKPTVNAGDWIKVKSSKGSSGIDGYVFSVRPDGSLAVGYYQNKTKAIKEDIVWDGEFWKFKYDGPNGSYLKGQEEALVKRGPIN